MKKLVCVLAALLMLTLAAAAAAETFTFSMVGDCTVGAQYKYRNYKAGFIAKVTEAVANRGNISEAIAALCSLGYGQSEAAAVLAGCDEASSVEELIKFGLKKLAKF